MTRSGSVQPGQLEQLRAGLRGAAAEALPRDDCPSPDQLWLAATGAGTAGERIAVLDHVAACFACAEAWQLAIEVGRGERSGAWAGLDEASGRERGPWRLAPRTRWALAASLLALAVGLGGWQLLRRSVPPVIDRGVSEPVVSSLIEGQALSPERCELRWSGPDGVLYEITATTRGLEIVARDTGFAEPSYVVAPAACRKASGDDLYWRIDAVSPPGSRTSSPTFTNRVE